MYWCDNLLSTIEYSNLDGTNKGTLLSDVEDVVTIALDPCHNDIYWISINNIFKMKLDGTERHQIVPGNLNLNLPNSLVIDFTSSRLYWTVINKVVASDLDGGNISVVYTTQSRRPTAISVYNNTLYWAEWKFKRITTCTIDGRNFNTFVNNVKKTAAIYVLHKSRQPGSCE